MKPNLKKNRSFWSITILAAAIAFPAAASFLQIVSSPDPAIAPSASAGGDSYTPILSADGRYVLFASTADNLALAGTNSPNHLFSLPKMNVYLHDRASNTTALVSVNLSGTGGGNGDSWPVKISTNGQYALFESMAGDLVANDTNNASDVFLRDLAGGTTILVSVSTNGASGDGASRNAVITPDARYVAFSSAATNLVAHDTNGIADIFVRDLQSGTTALASVGAKSTASITLPAISESPEISADGHYVAFYSSATNVVPGVRTAGEVYVRDLLSGNTTLASTNARSLFLSIAGSTNAVSCNQKISADGSYVVFEACTNPPSSTSARGIILRQNLTTGFTDLVFTNANVPLLRYEDMASLDSSPDGRFVAFVANVNGVTGNNTAIYLWDALYGTNAVISVDWSNALPAGAFCLAPSVSPDGRYVAFLSSAALTTNAPPGQHLYVRDVQVGITRLLDADTNGTGAGIGVESVPQLSADGSLAAFESADSNLFPGDRNHRYDVFVRNLTTDLTELISAHDPALPSQTPNGSSTIFSGSVSTDGRYAVFASDGDDLVADDTNSWRDVFVRDVSFGTNLLVSVNTNGSVAAGLSFEPAINGDGRYVAFSSFANDLAAGDTNKSDDVFVRDLVSGITTLVSVNSTGSGSGNNASYAPAISADGRYVLFRSKASNLAGGAFSGTENLFLRDLQIGTTYALTTTGVAFASMTPDGHFIAFVDTAAVTAGKIYLWDTVPAARVATNSTTPTILAISISPDGNRIASFSGSGTPTLSVLDRAANTNWVAGSGFPGLHAGLRFSRDGRFLTFASSTLSLGTNQVYLHDSQTRITVLISQSTNAPTAGAGVSDSPAISADGRFVAYRSAAEDLVPDSNNGVPDVFVYDRSLGTTTLLAGNLDPSLNSRSLLPVFSGDGQTLFFQSWASDLAANDFNQSSDLAAFVFLYASVIPGADPTISWPAVPGLTYHVEFKDNLSDSNWQSVPGTVTIIGNRGYLTDSAPDVSHRFYRVVAN